MAKYIIKVKSDSFDIVMIKTKKMEVV